MVLSRTRSSIFAWEGHRLLRDGYRPVPGRVILRVQRVLELPQYRKKEEEMVTRFNFKTNKDPYFFVSFIWCNDI